MNVLWFYSYISLWIVVILQGILLFAVLRQIGVFLLRLGPRGALNVSVAGGPEIGKEAPALTKINPKLLLTRSNGFKGMRWTPMSIPKSNEFKVMLQAQAAAVVSTV